jgi:hypothetical protein
MRKAVAIFLTILLLLQCSMKLVIVVYYQINKAYIASNLCENKAKPSMKCQGKCYLAKKLKAQENQEKGMTDLLKLVAEISFYFPDIVFDLHRPSFVSINEAQNGFYLIKPYTSQFASLFQPPRI